MQQTSIKVNETHYGEWKSALSFYKDELNVLKGRLTEVVSKNSGVEIMKSIEHFENQFLLQGENIDILQHDINTHLNKMAAAVQQHAGHINPQLLAEEVQLKDRYESESKVFNELRHEFNAFLSRVM